MMKPKVSLEVAAAGREHEVFPFLTLDVVHAFYDMMGLGPLLQAGLHRALRDATLVTRKEIVQALLLGEPKPMLAGFCFHVEDSIGAAATGLLSWWLQHVLFDDVQNHVALSRWTRILRHCQREGDDAWGQLPFPKQLSNEASERFATAVNVKEYYRRCERLDTRPLSDWDLHMYASMPYDFDDDLEGYGGSRPFTTISFTLRNYQEYQFWAWVLRVLDQDHQTRLREEALEIVRVEEFTSIKDLVHPSELDIGL